MKRSLLAVSLLLLAALPGAAQTKTRYMIGTKAAGRTAASRLLQSNDEMRAHDVRAFDNFDGFAATLSADEAATLRGSAGVRYVTYTNAQTVPYGVDLVHARELWPVTRGNRNIHVAVFDTGIDSTHPDLKHAYAGGYNTFDKTDIPFDDNRHGTHVSGIIGATDNNLGVVGVAPEADLWMVKVLEGVLGNGTDENVVDAVDWLLKKKQALGGNWIVNMSFGSGDASTAEQEAIAKLVAANVLPIAAAGNSGFAAISYPAAYPGVFAVGAVDANENRAQFSSYGAGLAIMAPGVDVLSTVPVGSIPSATAVGDDGTSTTEAAPLIGAKRGDLTGQLVFCGIGRPEDMPAGLAGKIAFMQRDVNVPFAEKVKNAVAAGAIGALIMNAEGSVAYQNWTLIRPDCTPDGCVPYQPDVDFNYPVVVALSTDAGHKFQALTGTKTTVTLSNWDDSYLKMSGTSMASPYACGVAALLWSLAPTASAVDIRNAMVLNTEDIGDPGVDLLTGWGMLDALSAAKFLSPGAFGITAPPAGPHRRSTRP